MEQINMTLIAIYRFVPRFMSFFGQEIVEIVKFDGVW